MQFLVIGRIEILVKIFLSLLEPSQRHFSRPSVLSPSHIGLPLSHFPATKHECKSTTQKQQQNYPEASRPKEETILATQRRLLSRNEPDIIRYILNSATFHARHRRLRGRRSIATLAFSDFNIQRFGMQGDIFPSIHVIIGIFYRRNSEISVTPGNEWELE